MAIELITTDGVFTLDGGSWDVTNNHWLLGNDREVLVFDAGHDHEPIVRAVGGRRVTAIACTHGHNDHIDAAVALREAVDAPVLLHAADRMLWDMVYAADRPDGDIEDGLLLRAGYHELRAVHTPGHSPGSCCFYDATTGMMISGDTLFKGGPGATNRSFADEPTILASIRDSLLTLPDDTVVHTGHGPTTTIGDERAGVMARLEDMGR